jgi:hypothetical protein
MEQKTTSNVPRVVAIVGFAIAIIVLAWLAIVIVRWLPGAFASLANLAEEVNNPANQVTLDVSTSNTVVNTRTAITISWTDLHEDGTYTFSYGCVDGVSADVRTANGAIVPLACDTAYTIPAHTFSLDVLFTSTSARFADVPYRIRFTPEDADLDSSEAAATLTVVNAGVPLVDNGSEAETPATTTPTTTTSKPSSGTVRFKYIQTPTYTIPTPDPNGYTDLSVSFLDAGTLDNRKVYEADSSISRDDNGAFRFEVKNIGTKTSGTWRFVAELPSGTTYRSELQDVLRPQERATITVAFGSAEDSGTTRIEVQVEGGNDTTTSNNDASASIRITR